MENETIQMLPVIITENNVKYYTCPICKRVISMRWDYNAHKVIYPDVCNDCGQLLKWEKRLVDLLPIDHAITEMLEHQKWIRYFSIGKDGSK